MPLQAQQLHEMAREQRLLRDLVSLVRRCDDRPPQHLLDAVLAGTSGARPAVPRQRERE